MENRSSFVRIAEMFDPSRMNPSMTVSSKSPGGFPPRKAKVQPRFGKRCPNCSITMSVSNICDCQ